MFPSEGGSYLDFTYYFRAQTQDAYVTTAGSPSVDEVLSVIALYLAALPFMSIER